MSAHVLIIFFLIDDSKKEGFDNVADFLRNRREDAAIKIALAEGGGDLSQYTLFFHGAPGTGKTSLKRVMLDQDPLPKEKQMATDIVENAVRAVTTDKVNGFKVIGEIEMINMLAEEVNSHYRIVEQQAVFQQSCTQATSSHTRDETNGSLTSDDSASSSMPSYGISDVVSIIVPTRTSAVLLIKKRLDGPKGSVKIYDSIWHNVVDSGGQPQFMDILPLVYRSPSLNVVVVRLTDSLDDKPKVRFYEEGEDVYTLPDQLQSSNRELIIKMCQVAASCNASGGVVPYVMIVGTHLDKLGSSSKAKVREFNEGLAEIRKEFSHVLICKSEDETIFPINTMAEGMKRQEYTKELQERITSVTRHHVSPVRVPLRWLVHQLDLESQGSVVRIGDCYKSGEAIGMKRDDVGHALKFCSDMALILYFPDDVPDLVLTKMGPLIGRLSKLVKSSFIPLKFCPPAESDRLHTKGLFDMSYLAKVLSEVQSNDLSLKEFVRILICLKIAVGVGKEEYFLPSALSLEPVTEQCEFKMSSVPLVFSWGDRFLPHGFFFTVVVELLGREGDYRFELRPDIAQWRGEIQVREATGRIPGVIKLTNRMKWIQVSSSSIDIQGDCPTIYKEVNIAVQKSITRFQHTAIGPPLATTLCPLCKSSDHYCLLSANKKVVTCAVNCSKTGPVNREMSCWFEGVQIIIVNFEFCFIVFVLI